VLVMVESQKAASPHLRPGSRSHSFEPLLVGSETVQYFQIEKSKRAALNNVDKNISPFGATMQRFYSDCYNFLSLVMAAGIAGHDDIVL